MFSYNSTSRQQLLENHGAKAAMKRKRLCGQRRCARLKRKIIAAPSSETSSSSNVPLVCEPLVEPCQHDPIVVVQRPKTTEEQLQVQVDELKSEKSQLEDIVRLKEERLVELEAEVVAMTDRL